MDKREPASIEYRPIGVAVVRVPLLPAATAQRLHTGEDTLEFAVSLLRQAQALEALRLTAPQLATALESAESADERARRHMRQSLTRYLNRMSLRPTPFGVLAGVGAVPVGGAGRLAATGERTVAARWDARFLAALAGRRNSHATQVMANGTLVEDAGRFWLDALDVPHGTPRTWAADPLLTSLLAAARRPVALDRLWKETARRHRADPGEVRRLTAELLRRRVLLPVRGPQPPPALRPLPVPGGSITPARLAALAAAQEDARLAAPGHLGPVVHCDSGVRFTADSGLPPQAAELAGHFAALLTEVGTSFGYPARLTAYAAAFVEEYGTGAEIPVLEALSSSRGLGLPDGYGPAATAAAPAPAVPPYAGRDAVLHRLLARALLDGDRAVTLTAADLDALREASAGPDDRPPLPALDVLLQFVPPRAPADRWRAVAGPLAAAPLSRVTGRFHGVLPSEHARHLVAAARAEQRLLPAHRVVALRYRPSAPGMRNVVCRTAVHPWELPLNVPSRVPAERTLGITDVLLGAHAGRLYLRSARDGRLLHLVQSDMVDPSREAPLPRFLMEVCTAAFRFAPRFDWGGLEAAPFLPRVEAADCVLRRARWRLTRGEAEAKGGSAGRGSGLVADLDGEVKDTLGEGLRVWRRRFRVPRHVLLGTGDATLHLDLDSPASLRELRGALAADGEATLVEALPAQGEAFVTGPGGDRHACELVVPVLRDGGEELAAMRRTTAVPPAPVPAPRGTRHRPLGSEWAAVHLDVPFPLQDEVLLGQVAVLLDKVRADGLADGGFFTRIARPRPHLRVRVHQPDPRRGADLRAALAEWCADAGVDGRITGMSLCGYRRDVQRYGGPLLIGPSEALFVADTEGVLALLDAPLASCFGRQRLAALTLEVVAARLVPDAAERLALATRLTGPGEGGAEYRAAGRLLWPMFGERGRTRALAVLEDRWDRAAPPYRALSERELAPPARELALRSLLHMHCNRLGLSRAAERTAYGLWLRLLRRTRAGR